jgi:1,4-alpha-glucan branching enzyme
MIKGITNFIQKQCWTTTTPPGVRPTSAIPHRPGADRHEQQTGYNKVFRWPVPAEQTPQPTTVEVAGSFSGWRKVPLAYDPPTKTWQITVNGIEGNRTHQYVILVDGRPSYDKTCDGLAAPQTPDEAKWRIETPKGPRVMLLFGQTK